MLSATNESRIAFFSDRTVGHGSSEHRRKKSLFGRFAAEDIDSHEAGHDELEMASISTVASFSTVNSGVHLSGPAMDETRAQQHGGALQLVPPLPLPAIIQGNHLQSRMHIAAAYQPPDPRWMSAKPPQPPNRVLPQLGLRSAKPALAAPAAALSAPVSPHGSTAPDPLQISCRLPTFKPVPSDFLVSSQRQIAASDRTPSPKRLANSQVCCLGLGLRA